MPLTRAAIELTLIRPVGLGPRLVDVGLDGTTSDGSNADLTDALVRAAISMGLPLADPSTVTDADLAGLSGQAYLRFLDYATLFALGSILGRWDLVDWSAGNVSEQSSQLLGLLKDWYERLSIRVNEPYEDVPLGSPGASASAVIHAGSCGLPGDPLIPYPNDYRWGWATHDRFGRPCR